MWKMIYIAHTKDAVDKIQLTLISEGVSVKVNPIGNNATKDGYFEILVPEEQVNEAHEIIIDKGYNI